MQQLFNRFADRVTQLTGHPLTFLVNLGLVLVWLASGPVLHFNDAWNFLANTSTTIVTFLMVFLIQNNQNRASAELQALIERIAADERAELHLLQGEAERES